MKTLLAYLRYRRLLLVYHLAATGLILLMFYLLRQEMLYAFYTAGLLSAMLFAILLIDFGRFCGKHHALSELIDRLPAAADRLPTPGNAIERAYDELLGQVCRSEKQLSEQLNRARTDTLDYYTLWVHQIKTPIAAMRLVLDAADSQQSAVLRRELFEIERYADLALRYVKLSDIASDLVIETAPILPTVRESVKKFGLPVIYRRISITIEEMDAVVTTDRRWLGFILEQLLSNAVKYTKTGGITIGWRGDALFIEDTGIGIRKEDLPRIFEKGYTGYNGRIDTRASGIGLYLVRRTANALAIRVAVESEVGRGTRVTLRFPKGNEFAAHS